MPKLDSPDPDAERFGRIVTRLRLEHGWEKQKLATRIGITPQYMGIIEQGLNVPSLKTVLDLLEILRADAGEVMRELLATRNTAKQ
jgi:transcriptional regulator with XRE-family HTH domain